MVSISFRMNRIPQVCLVVAALLLLLPISGSLSSSDSGDFLENFLSQSHNSSVLSVFFGTEDAATKSPTDDGTGERGK